jgi:glycosyltransferase involved in cell wall biosynthesis
MRLSILIPVYNEGDTIAAVLRRVVEAGLSAEVERELVVINDGSTDRTDQELRDFRDKHPDTVLAYRNEPVNRGKGWCLRQGIGLASGQVVVVHDADLEYDPADHAAMLEPILDDRADVVYGSRFLTGVKSTWWHRGANQGLTRLMNLCSGLRLTDLHTGLKMFRTDLLRGLPLVEDRFGFCPEVTARLAKMPGVRWVEVPVSYRPRTCAQGKKIRFKDGLRAVYCILRYTWPWRMSVGSDQRPGVSRQGAEGRGQRSIKGDQGQDLGVGPPLTPTLIRLPKLFIRPGSDARKSLRPGW